MREFLKRLLCIAMASCLVGYLIPERPVYAAGWTVSSHHESSGPVGSGSSVTLSTVNTGDSIFWTFGANQNGVGTVTAVSTTGGTCTTPGAKIAGATFTGNIDSSIWAASGCSSSITAVSFTASAQTWVVDVAAVSGLQAVVTVDTFNTANGASDGGNPTTNAPSVTASFAGDFIVSTFDPVHSIVSPSPNTGVWTCDCFNFSPFAYLTSNSAAAGTYGTQWASNGSAAFAAAIAAFRSAASTSSGYPVVIKFQHPRYRIPSDDRKHKLEIVTI